MCIRISDWFTAAHMTYYNNYNYNWFSKMDVNTNILKTVTDDYNELLQTIFNYPSATANYVIECVEKRTSILCRQ